jgi:hypothetical protein
MEAIGDSPEQWLEKVGSSISQRSRLRNRNSLAFRLFETLPGKMEVDRPRFGVDYLSMRTRLTNWLSLLKTRKTSKSLAIYLARP